MHVFVVFIWAEISYPHLEHGHVVLPVDLVGRRVKPVALSHVLVENAAALHVAQTELTEVELREPVTSKQSHISFYSIRSKVHEHMSLVNAHMILSCQSLWMIMTQAVCYLLYSCGYGEEYHV